MFSFEAGRRCESGPGNFTFETKQGNEIFHIVEESIREQKAQAEERHQSCRSLPEPPPPVEDQGSLYSEPADSVRAPPSPGDCLYSDPVDSIKVLPTPNPRLSRHPADGSPTEHIYDEPEGRAGSAPPIITLYDEARLEMHSWRTRGMEEPQCHEVAQQPLPVPRPKGPKPVTAPKPGKVALPKKDTPPLPQIKGSANLNNNNSSNSHNSTEGVRRDCCCVNGICQIQFNG
uniref:IRS-type PTB domain-containing protein n=1 Tax=Sinocyclocheilus rhinocerous TaxID=307959 RepID=A0A673ICE7_9TELE